MADPSTALGAGPVRQIPGAVGPLEAILDRPSTEPRVAVVFAHPLPTEGGTMHTKVVFQAAKALSRIGCVVLRFNFRGVGLSAGTWDRGRGEMDDFKAALDYTAATYPDLDVWAAGFSFGPLCGSLREFRTRCGPHSGPRRAERAKRNWQPAKGSVGISRAQPLAGSHIATTAGADDDRVCALIAIAPPVDRYAFASVKLSRKPKFIVHGGRDELISIRMVRHFYAQLHEPKELVEIDGADHLFDGQAAEVGDALVDLLEDFSCTTLSS